MRPITLLCILLKKLKDMVPNDNDENSSPVGVVLVVVWIILYLVLSIVAVI